MHAPCLIDDISMAGLHGFVKIIHMYLRTADVWICWFACFAFVKPSRLHLQTSDINASFGAALDFSQNYFCISLVISTFDGVCFSSSLLINQIGIHSSNPFSCSAVEGIGWKYHLNGGSHWYNCCTMLFYICSVPAFRWSPIQFFLQIKFTFSKVKLPLFER